MSDFVDELQGINQDIISGVMILVGIVFAFFGSKWFKYIIFFVGFCIGGIGGYFLMGDLALLFKWNLTTESILYISLGLGAALGFILVALYKLAVFCTGAIFGIILSQILWKIIIAAKPDLPQRQVIQFALITVFAISFGLLAFCFVKQVLKIITAFIGSFFFAAALAYFIQRIAGTNKNDSTNVIDWVSFFSNQNTYNNGSVSAVCDGYCILCIYLSGLQYLLQVCMFIQYKFNKIDDD